MSETSDKVIMDYFHARVLAGTVGDGNPLWNYSNGWYSVGYGKYRRVQVEKMTENLLKRAQAKP